MDYRGLAQRVYSQPHFLFPVGVLSLDEKNEIEQLFKRLYGRDVCLGSFVKTCKRLILGNEIIATQTAIGTPYSLILARRSDVVPYRNRPAVITNLLEVKIKISGDEERKNHFIAKVKWLKANDNQHVFGVNSNLDVWSTDFEDHSFIPTKFIGGRALFIKQDIDVSVNHHLMVDRVYLVMSLPTRSILV